MYYIEKTSKINHDKVYNEREIYNLPKWFNEQVIKLIVEKDVSVCVLLTYEHSAKIKSHFSKLTFDFNNFDYILWRKSNDCNNVSGES